MSIYFKVLGVTIYTLCGLWSFFISMAIVTDNLGFIGSFFAFMIFPATITFAPLYEALANSNWFLFILTYGGAIIGGIFFWLGSHFEE